MQAVNGGTRGQVQLRSLLNLRSEFNHFDASNFKHETTESKTRNLITDNRIISEIG